MNGQAVISEEGREQRAGIPRVTDTPLQTIHLPFLRTDRTSGEPHGQSCPSVQFHVLFTHVALRNDLAMRDDHVSSTTEQGKTRRSAMCSHQPPCPDAIASDHDAALVIAA